MRRSTFVLFSFLASLLLAVVSPATAGEPQSAQSDLIPGLYLESTGHAVYIKAPKVEGLGIYAADNFLVGPPIQFKNEGRVNDVGGGWDGRLGFQLPYVDLPSWLDGLNVELGGSYAQADSEFKTDIDLRSGPGSTFTPVPINGRSEIGFLGTDQILRERFQGDVQIWDARIGAAMDLDLADFVKSRARAGLQQWVSPRPFPAPGSSAAWSSRSTRSRTSRTRSVRSSSTGRASSARCRPCTA